MTSPENDPTGRPIDSYTVKGKEFDQDRWVGADVLIVVQKVGPFLLNIVTKDAYRNQAVERAVLEPQELSAEMFAVKPEFRDPYVVNDPELSDEVLKRLLSRPVSGSLAAALWHDYQVRS